MNAILNADINGTWLEVIQYRFEVWWVGGGRPNLVLAKVHVFCPGPGQDLTGPGPELDNMTRINRLFGIPALYQKYLQNTRRVQMGQADWSMGEWKGPIGKLLRKLKCQGMMCYLYSQDDRTVLKSRTMVDLFTRLDRCWTEKLQIVACMCRSFWNSQLFSTKLYMNEMPFEAAEVIAEADIFLFLSFSINIHC